MSCTSCQYQNRVARAAAANKKIVNKWNSLSSNDYVPFLVDNLRKVELLDRVALTQTVVCLSIYYRFFTLKMALLHCFFRWLRTRGRMRRIFWKPHRLDTIVHRKSLFNWQKKHKVYIEDNISLSFYGNLFILHWCSLKLTCMIKFEKTFNYFGRNCSMAIG